MSAYSGPLHRSPPFRAEHIGSLKRTQELLDKRDELDAGKITRDDIKPLEQRDIKDIVKIQEELGFHAITDGEYARHMFFDGFWDGLEGIEEVKIDSTDIFRMYVPDIAAFAEAGYKPAGSTLCTGKIKHVESRYAEQFKFLAAQVPKDKVKDLKITLAAPNWYHLRYKEGEAYPKSVYATDDEYFADIAKAYQQELQILYDHGCRNVQFDDPNLAYFCSEKMIEGWAADPANPYPIETLLSKYLSLYNSCISRAPSDLHLGIHLCRGNFVESRHFSEGSYDRIATQLFRDIDFHTYYLEYDTPRAGGFEPLQHLPPNKSVILGVITSKFPKLEDLDEMKKRVLEAADWVVKGGSAKSREEALQRLGVSPQCGFASHSHGNLVTREDMFEKLKLVRRLAEEIWPGQP